jgi:hypothetical protein
MAASPAYEVAGHLDEHRPAQGRRCHIAPTPPAQMAKRADGRQAVDASSPPCVLFGGNAIDV